MPPACRPRARRKLLVLHAATALRHLVVPSGSRLTVPGGTASEKVSKGEKVSVKNGG